MEKVILKNGFTIEAKNMLELGSNNINVVIRSIYQKNKSPYIYLTYCEAKEKKEKYQQIYNWGLSDAEKQEVYEMVMRVLKEPPEEVFAEKISITALYASIKEEMINNANSERIGDDSDIKEYKGIKEAIDIEEGLFTQILGGIADCGRTKAEILRQLKTDGLLRCADGRNRVQKRLIPGENGQWIYSIYKKDVFEDVKIGHPIGKKADKEGGED